MTALPHPTPAAPYPRLRVEPPNRHGDPERRSIIARLSPAEQQLWRDRGFPVEPWMERAWADPPPDEKAEAQRMRRRVLYLERVVAEYEAAERRRYSDHARVASVARWAQVRKAKRLAKVKVR